MSLRTIRVARIDEFDDPGKKVITDGDDEVGVFRLGDDFYAWRNVCPHQGGPVCQGRFYKLVRENLDDELKSHGRLYDDDKINIVCPWHGLEFDVRTGCHPGTGDLALEPATVQVQGGEVYVIL